MKLSPSAYIAIAAATVFAICFSYLLYCDSEFLESYRLGRSLRISIKESTITNLENDIQFRDTLREMDESGFTPNTTIGTKVYSPFVSSAADEGLQRKMKLQSGCASSDLTYHGGPILTSGVNVYTYYIGSSEADYGSSSSTANILTQLISTIGGSNYLKAATTYKNGGGIAVRNQVNFRGKYNYVTRASSLNDSYVRSTFIHSINYRGVPVDSNGVYVVFFRGSIPYNSFTAAGIYGPGWCGYHSAINFRQSNGVRTVLKFIVIGDPTYSPPGSPSNMGYCTFLKSGSPNGNAAADAMASVLSHELVESMTDPQFDGWYDAAGCEAADRCLWYFGTSANYNTNFGGKNWLLQQLWAYNPPRSGCTICYNC